MIFFAEMPKLQEGELSSVKQKKEAEGPELDIAGLVSKSNGIIDGYTAQLEELPIEFNQMLHNEIVKYFLASPGRYEKDENSGLSTAEFEAYRADMVNKVSALMKEYAPTEEDLKAVREAKAGAESAEGAAKNVEPLDVEEVTENPGQINDLETLNEKYGQYDGWNTALRTEGAEVMKTAGAFQQAYAKYEKARKGVRAYKKFVAYFWPNKDQERIELQNKLAEAKSKVDAAIGKFEATKDKLSGYGTAMGEVSNRLKQEKMAERDAKIREVENTSTQTEEARKEKELKYHNLEARKKEMESSRDNLVNYREKIGKGKKEFTNRSEVAKNKQEQLTEFSGALKATVERIDNALANPDLPPETRAQLEYTRKQLEGKQSEADTGLNAATKVVEGGAKTVVQLEGAEKEAAERSLNLNTHLEEQVNPAIDGLDASIANLDEAKMQFATTKEQVNAHYQKAFEQYDEIDGAVDSAVMQNNLANASMLTSLRSQKAALNSANLAPPSGVIGFLESTAGVQLSVASGLISMAGEGILDQATWLSKSLEDARSEMGTFSYVAARIGVELISTPIGVAGGLVEMAGGIVTLVAHPIDTVKGLGALVGANPDVSAGEAWEGMGKALISYEDFKAGRIGVGVGKIFANIATTVTGAGALGAGGKAAQGAYVAARMGTATVAKVGVTRALARAGVAGARESAVYVGSAVKSGAKGAVQLPGRAVRGAQRGVRAVKEIPGAVVGRLRGRGKAAHLDEASEAVPLVRRAGPDTEPLPLNRRSPTDTEPFPLERRRNISGEHTGAETPASRARKPVAEEATGAATPEAIKRPAVEDATVAERAGTVRTTPPEPHGAASTGPETITAAERTEAVQSLTSRVGADPELARRIEAVGNKNGMMIDDFMEEIQKLDAAEIQILNNMPPEALTESIIQKIVKGEYDEITDIVGGEKVSLRYYFDDSQSLGAGGMGKVNVGYTIRWVKDGSGKMRPQMKRVAIKQPHPYSDWDTNDPIRNMMDYEEATMRAIRDLPDQTGLLRPHNLGRRIVRDRAGNVLREELITMTELLKPLPGLDSVGMRTVMENLPLDQSLGYLDDILGGMERLHGTGRMHFDIKPGNFFVGMSEGRPTAVLGDLGAIPSEHLRYIQFETGLDDAGKVIHQPIMHLPDGRVFRIPITPTYSNRGINQLRYAVEWAKANPDIPIPRNITAITDLGQTAKVMEFVDHIVTTRPHLLPASTVNTIRARLKNITTAIDDVPDVARLDESIKLARAGGDPAKIRMAEMAKAEALRRPPRVTVGDLRRDVQRMMHEIRRAQARGLS